MSVTSNLGIVTAYGEAVNAGYTGTKEQFAADQANFAENAAAVAADKAAAETAKAAAETAQGHAETAQAAAESAKADAESAKANASASARNASTSETNAATSATNAATSESNAAESEANAAATLASAVRTVAQTLTDGEKSQARDNINAAATNGYYSEMGVGTSDNLAGKGDGVGASYIYRTTNGSADVANGRTTIKSIKGNTLVWNQLAVLRESRTSGGLTFTNNGNGSITITGTCTVTDIYTMANVSAVVGHKYLNRARGAATNNQILEKNGAVNPNGNIVTNAYAANSFYLNGVAGTSYDLTVWIECFDLTMMFGTGNEPSSVADFKALFPNAYYEYDAGSLLSFNATGIKTVGFNAFNGTYAAVLGGNAYYIGGAYTALGFTDTLGGTTESITPVNNLYTPPTNGYIYVTGGADTCINLSWSGIRNGEYEEYWTQTRNIPIATYFPNGMRSAGAAYDELTANKATTRIGVIDLGSLTWSIYDGVFYSPVSTRWTVASGLKCILYTQYGTTVGGAAGMADKRMQVFPDNRLYIQDFTYTTANAFQAAMSGVYLFYEMATPTEVEIETPLNLVYMVSDFGTEEIITADNAETAPCNMSVVYGMNAVDFIRNAPKNYISVESFDGFAAALGAALNVTITKTWDSTNGKYTFTVVANS